MANEKQLFLPMDIFCEGSGFQVCKSSQDAEKKKLEKNARVYSFQDYCVKKNNEAFYRSINEFVAAYNVFKKYE